MILLGNLFSFVGCGLMVAFGFVKRKDRMLTVQCFQFGFQSLGNIVLGSVTGFFSCILSIVRILVFTKVKVTVWLKLAFIAIQAALSLWAGADSLYEWIPFFSMLAYTWYLDTDSAVTFKIVNLIGSAMWVFHDFHYLNYTAFTFDILAIVSTLAGIVMLLRDEKTTAQKE